MLTDGINLIDNSTAVNFVIDSGPTLPSALLEGELFYQTGAGLQVYDGSAWVSVSSGTALTGAAVIAALGYTPAALDNTGFLTAAQIPAIAITNTSVVASQVAMLALTAEIGDVAVRTDLNATFILKATGASTLSNWQQLLFNAPAYVSSVSVTTANGVSGTVANSSTTPAITLTLGAITPTSVVSSGAVSGTSLSGTSLTLTSTISVGGDTGTSGYILTSGGPSATPTWVPNNGPTTLSATGTFPSITGATGVYAGVTSTDPRIDIYNISATAGNRLMYITAHPDGTSAFGFTNSGGSDQDWLTLTRVQEQATILAFNSTATTFSGTVSATTFTGAHSGSGAALTNLNANNLASGTVAIARLGSSGTPSGTTFLRGDNVWATPAGTVSSVSVVTANGVSGSVATSTSTPAITLTLGAITPSSVASTGAVSGTSLSAGGATGTITGRLNTRSASVTGVTTVTPTADSVDFYSATSQAAAFTVAAPTGTPVTGQKLMLFFADNGTSRAITWTTSSGAYRAFGTTLPTATVANKGMYVGCIWNSIASFWDVIAVAQL